MTLLTASLTRRFSGRVPRPRRIVDFVPLHHFAAPAERER